MKTNLEKLLDRKEEVISLIKESKSTKEILDKLGFNVRVYHYELIRDLANILNIELPIYIVTKKVTKPLHELLVENSNCGNGDIKRRLLKVGLLVNICCLCNQKSEWNGKFLTLQLDHINGNRKDNRLENLRILCPNCHTQTDTYSSKRFKTENKKCSICNVELKTKQSINCRKCSAKNKQSKINWPSIEEINNRIWKDPVSIVAKEFGISDTYLSRFCKRNNIKTPPRGYWQKLAVEIARKQHSGDII